MKTLFTYSKKKFLIASFFTDFISLNTSSAINKLLNFILFVFLVRYLTVEQYGIYTFVWAHTGILAALTDFGTTSYGLLHLSRTRIALTDTLISFRFYASVVAFIIVALSGFFIASTSSVSFYITLISLSILTNMWSGTFLILASISKKAYKPAVISVLFNTVLVITLIAGLISGYGLKAIFITNFIFIALELIAYFLLVKNIAKKLTLRFEPRKWFSIIRTSYLFVVIGFFVGWYYRQNIYLLTFLKGEEAVGIYSAGYKFFDALMFIAASYNIVTLPEMARLVNKKRNKLINKILNDIKLLAVVGIVISFIIFSFSPLLLPLVLKKEFINAIDVVRVVIFAFPFILFNSVLFNTLYAFKKTLWVVILSGTQVAINLLLNIIYIPRFSYMASSYITVISEVINFIILGLLVYLLVRNKKIPQS